MDRVSGLVVAGGSSTRFGTDKRTVRLGGITLLDRAIALLAAVADDVMVAAQPSGTVDLTGLPATVRVVPDARPDRGPMAGILAGLRLARWERLLVIPADMPMLTPQFLRFLIDRAPDAAVTVPQWEAGLEPLVAVYRRTCVPGLAALVERGTTAIHAFISSTELPVRRVHEPEIRTHGDPALLFLNINTPDDLTRAERELGRRPPDAPR
jgi:molybdopterin-guanine dinucleotide biosynthesis protein A